MRIVRNEYAVTIPMIHAGALGNIPEFLEAELGWRRVEQAFHAVGLPPQVTDYPESRIPWASVMLIIEAGARCVGDEDFGLVLSRHTTFETYGTWGAYLRSAPTLRDALERVESTMHYHSPSDRFWLSRTADGVRVTYRFALVGSIGSDNSSYCAAGVLISLIRNYLGSSWGPRRLNLCVPKRRRTNKIDETFGCDVVLGGEVISFELSDGLLGTPRPITRAPLVTLADVERARGAAPPATLSEVVTDLLRVQLLNAAPSMEGVARTLDLGGRTLQRRLSEEGVKFRQLERRVLIARAKELMSDSSNSITDIAFAMHYESAGHFSRAFTNATGMTPSEYRKTIYGFSVQRKSA